MHRRMTILGSVAIAVAALVPTGCTVSEETKGYANEAVCVSADTTIKSLEGTGAGARAAASLIRDNTDDERIREVAQEVIDGNMDESLREELAAWVGNACG